MKTKDISITFHVESADRSVGIMAEGFSAWENDGNAWCDLNDIGRTTRDAFTWYCNDTGNAVAAPESNGIMIENMLRAYAESWYEQTAARLDGYCSHAEAEARITSATSARAKMMQPKSNACVWCNGTGRIPATGIVCRTCGGSGKVSLGQPR